jgi:hypothetical protein
MATTKTSKSSAAFIHASMYAIPFLFLTTSAPAMAVIVGTHFIVDRWRLARFVVWAKNWILAPPRSRVEWGECSEATGYPKDTPGWLAVWLLIIVDNTIHIVINAAALHYLS